MLKTKWTAKILVVFAMVMVLLLVGLSTVGVYAAEADTKAGQTGYDTIEDISYTEDKSERLFTNLQIGLKGGDGEVWATVKNNFTLFPSTVYVIVQLFSSEVYCEDYEDMTLMAMNSTLDLNMGSTIEARASTGGKQLYWMGRMRYKIDGASWEEKTVGVGLYSADGEFLGLT